jgi:hypothetical protein
MQHSKPQDPRNSKRVTGRLNSKLEKNLLTYVAAASAAGVGMLASPEAVEAEVVYTPVRTTINYGITLDLNNDGIADFYLIPFGAASIGGSLRISYLQVCHIPENGFSHQCVSSSSKLQTNADNVVRVVATGAAALPPGATIGGGPRFSPTGVAVWMGGRDFYSRSSNTAQHWIGPWVNGGKGVFNRYLGLKFKIDGEFHFGWARLNVTTTAHSGFVATLTGYAYETIPGKAIVAGQTTGSAETSNLNPIYPIMPVREVDPSLGSLALGAPGLSIWRREEASN